MDTQMMLKADERALLRSAFPQRLSASVDAVLDVLPPGLYPPSTPLTHRVRIGGEEVSVLRRVYYPQPPASSGLTPTEAAIVCCVYTRHSNGFVRERYLPRLLPLDEPWIVPFVLALLGEYVVEICGVVANHLDLLPQQTYAAFARENPDYMRLTQARIVSYWNCYYHTIPFREYPAYQVLSALQLWDPRIGRRLLERS